MMQAQVKFTYDDVQLKDFRLLIDIQMRFRDTDAMGHVNNAAYLSYLEIARVDYWKSIHGRALDYDKINFIVGRAAIEYRSPIRLVEPVKVGIRCVELRGASFDFHYAVFAGDPWRLSAVAMTTQVMIDRATGKPARILDDFRSKIHRFENYVKAV